MSAVQRVLRVVTLLVMLIGVATPAATRVAEATYSAASIWSHGSAAGASTSVAAQAERVPIAAATASPLDTSSAGRPSAPVPPVIRSRLAAVTAASGSVAGAARTTTTATVVYDKTASFAPRNEGARGYDNEPGSLARSSGEKSCCYDGSRCGAGASRALPRAIVAAEGALPELSGTVADSFEGGSYTTQTFKAGTTFYRAEGANQGVGSFLGLTEPSSAADAEELYNIAKWGNPAEIVSTYTLTEDTTMYVGQVAGGTGTQALLPAGVSPGSVLRLVGQRSLG
jgi:hypothetical protein